MFITKLYTLGMDKLIDLPRFNEYSVLSYDYLIPNKNNCYIVIPYKYDLISEIDYNNWMLLIKAIRNINEHDFDFKCVSYDTLIDSMKD